MPARLVDLDGSDLLVLTSTRPHDDPLWFTSFDFGYPDVREDAEDREDADGQNDTTMFVGGRGITGTFTLPMKPAAPAAAEQLKGLMHPGSRYYLHVQLDDWSGERRILVRPAGYTDPYDEGVHDGQAQWKAPLGLWEAADPLTFELSPAGATAGGVAAPWHAPFGLTPANMPGSVMVDNPGSVATPSVVDIYGPCSAPILRLDPDELVSFPTLSIPENVFLRVDFAARTALLNGDPAQSVFNKRDFTVSSWWSLPKGRSTVSLSATNPGAGCRGAGSFRPRFV